MSTTNPTALPSVVYAQASPLSQGGTSLFDSPSPIRADEVAAYTSEETLLRQAIAQLSSAGFQVLQSSPITINIAGPPDLYERYFETNLRADRREVLLPGSREGVSTFIDAADT